MKKHKKWKKRTRIIGEIGIVSVLFAVIFIVIGSFQNNDKENISKADYSGVKIGATDFGGDYGLKAVSASAVNPVTKGQKLMTVSASFYNYRYDNEITKGWRDQGIDGELSGVANPFSKFNSKLSAYYKENSAADALPFGVYVGNFYNHWTGSYNAKNYNWCIKNYTGFAWAQNIANRGTYSAVCQGLVGDELNGFKWTADEFVAGDLMCNNNSTTFPLFNEAFLEQKNSSSDSIGIGVVANQVGFPFRYEHNSEKGTHYVFDSKYDSVTFAGSSGNGYTSDAKAYEYYYGTKTKSTTDSPNDKPVLNYYYQTNPVNTRSNSSAQFLPFNTKGTAAKDIDFGFGMRVDIPFYLTENGYQTAADGGKPMKFNFEGDDDVWVFIDGKLALDLGGAHAKTVGSIDFSGTTDTMKVYAKTVSYNKDGTTTAGTNNFENGADNTNVSEYTATKDITKGAVHVMTIFYMERGMIESNLYMDFNFIPHKEEVEQPSYTGDSVQTDSELTVKTEIDFGEVATPFIARVKELAEDDAFQYKIENAGTGTGNVQDSGIKYPSGELSVRDNEGQRSYWSFGKQPKIRIYFDLAAAKENVSDANIGIQDGTVSDSNNDAYKTTWSQPYITVNNVRQEMDLYKDKIYYSDVNEDDEFYFTSDQKVQQFGNYMTSSHSTWTREIWVNNVKYDYTFVVKNGVLYKPVGFISNRQNEFACASELANDNHPANSVSSHSMNLPYQTVGSSSNFSPTNGSDYNSVANTTYQLTEGYPAEEETYDETTMSGSTDIHIFQNTSPTSGKTSSSGIFYLLSEDSATFLKQFRMDSNMRVTQQDMLGTMVRPKIVSGAEDGNSYVSYADEGTRESRDFYYTTVSAKNISSTDDERDVTVSKTGEFKFANVKASDADADFTASDKITISETFTNQVKTGNLCISKKITGMKNAGDLEYTFKIQFKNVFGVTDSDYTGYALDYVLYDSENNGTTKTLKADDPTVTLKQGEKVIIEGIPAGTEYQIVETNPENVAAGDISVSYTTKVDGATKMQTDVDMDNLGTGDNISTVKTGTTGTIVGTVPKSVKNSSTSEDVNEFDEVDVNITFTNQKGVIRLEKLAIGEWKNFKDEEYTFTIKEDDDLVSDYTYDVYEYNKTTGEEEIAKDSYGNKLENCTITDGKITIKATQWALIQDIPLTTEKTYTITETIGDYFKINSIDVNKGNCETEANLTDGTISMELSNDNPKIDVTYVNRYDPSYVEIAKYVDKLYYQTGEDGAEKEFYSGKTYQSLTDAKQSFIFKIEEFASKDKATAGTDIENTFYVTIPVENGNVLSSVVTYPTDDGKEYRYKNSETIKLTLGKWYRVSEDTNWSWKYNYQGVEADLKTGDGNNGTVEISTDKSYVVFEGGDEDSMPVINFYNTLTTDETKLSTEGDTDSIPNKIKTE